MMMNHNKTVPAKCSKSSARLNSEAQKTWKIPSPERKKSISFQAIIEEQKLQQAQESKTFESMTQPSSLHMNGTREYQPLTSRRTVHNVYHKTSKVTNPSQNTNISKIRVKNHKPKNRSRRNLTKTQKQKYEYTQEMMHEDYLYTCSQMYSYTSLPQSPGHITEDNMSIEECAKYVSLDCEMVGVGPKGFKSAVARVCIVNWDGNVVFDTFVKVSEPVTDFRTYVSGIREKDLLSDNAMDFETCRNLVKSILNGRVLIGHALKNDLQALMISHPWYDIRDTAKYEPFLTTQRKFSVESDNCSLSSSCSSSSMSSFSSTGQNSQLIFRPRRLKDLAEELLGIPIQVEGREHSPIEDARAALSLYKLQRNRWERVMEYKVNKTMEMMGNDTISSPMHI